MRSLQPLTFFLVAVFSLNRASSAEERPRPAERPNLSALEIDALEADLQDPDKRLPAIAALAEFASYKLYQVGSVIMVGPDREQDVRRERAAVLARKYADAETVRMALDSDNPRLQSWGLWFWRKGFDVSIRATGTHVINWQRQTPTAEEQAWLAMIPKIRNLAVTSDNRISAIDALAGFGLLRENREFLQSLIPQEKSADVILHLVERTAPKKKGADRWVERDQLFDEQLIRLLGDPDPRVRRSALTAIGFNWNNAPMYQVHFTTEVANRVQELQRSNDAEENRTANFAAKGLQKIGKIWTERSSAQ
jgi:hypothetical protein